MKRRMASVIILLALLAMPAVMYGEDLKEKADAFVKSVPENMMYIMLARVVAAGVDA